MCKLTVYVIGKASSQQVNLGGSLKFYAHLQLHGGLVPLTLALFKGHLYKKSDPLVC